MPRTKQKKAKRTSLGAEQIMRDFSKLIQLRVNRMELDFKALEQRYEASLQMALNRYPVEIQNVTIDELLTIQKTPKKENIPPKTPKLPRDSRNTSMKPLQSAKPKRVTTVSDDGYQSESAGSQASKATATTKRRSRSSSQNRPQSRIQSLSQDAKLKLSRSQSVSRDPRSKLNPASALHKKYDKESMRTPTNKAPSSSFVITPKVKLNSAMNVLRKPKEGEMVFSTQGSPLLVSTTVNGRTANINVPLRDGKVVSLLPFHETSLSENLNLDEETKHQLKILQSHLAKVLD
ncbi:hypothetical protein QAD02_016209 [Eretmocerus hayati]|uniref:Uncharacterized protein n=1 Tax=Eretmocerus hayati TaxID=131215 RepID=A0ACC2PAT4_9HYME|nr:hypothetical protein QAD02_016209 [Eretmocerus hayati]